MEATQSDDLASLDSRTIINETTVIELLRKRYTQDRIYTFIGDILLFVNPFKYLPIYGPEWIQTYQSTRQISNLAPHVYSKAKDVLRSLRFSSTSQCCVVTGDSGAGKTEVTKHILQYITTVSISKDACITSKLNQVYCILEAFGNATTLQNKNSSRFALYFEILFSNELKIFGGKVYHYMLEKSRVVHQKKGGKNFHIFHYILSGMSVEQRQEFHLSVEYPHRYLSYDPMVPAEDDSPRGLQREKFEKLLSSLDALGFTAEDNFNIFKVLAAILHVGNVEFGVVDPQSSAAFVHDQQPVSCASSLLGVDANDLGTALVVGTAFHKGEKVSVRKNPEIAAEGRDNLAKALYSRLFAWIVFKMSRCLMVSEEGTRELMGPSIGLLDMFGFQKFDVNGLEQLCVNMTNEQLAYFYSERVFAWEQAEMESDGLRGHKTPYHDNKKALELLLSPPQGLFPLLDAESQSPKGTDAGFVKKCDNIHRKHPYYNSAKLSYPAFYVQHFNGHVNYVALGFITTNLDLLGTSLLHCMQGSKNEYIRSLFEALVSGTGSVNLQPDRPISPVTDPFSPRKKDKRTGTPEIRHKEAVLQHLFVPENRHRFPSLVNQYRNSIAELMRKVLACDVHFVRCIKPNHYQSSDQFDHDTVLIQARSAVVVLTAHARSVGFPIWMRFPNFIHRFGFLVGLHSNPVAKNASQTCEKMLRKLFDPRGWKIGKTKVFLSCGCMDRLNALMDRVNSCATIIQKVLRGWYARKLYKRLVHLKGVQKKTVSDFLAALGSQSEGLFQHISNQVMEEDTREMRKRNEGVQRKPWSPAVLDQRSPASVAKDLDEPDAAGQTSPRPPSLQEKVSDLSVSSLTDVFGPDSPTRPMSPQHRESNLSVVSVESNFSVESEDIGRPSEIWCRVTCFERQFSRAEFSIDRSTFFIDGSNNAFDVTRIGLGSLPESSDSKVNKVRGYIGEGIKIATDEECNVWVTRKSKKSVYVKGHFLSEEVISSQGSLVIDKVVKVFDWESFVEVVRHYCQPQIFNPDLETAILSSASVFISFVKDGKEDVETPCWVQLDVLAALEQATAACRFANERQLEAKREKMNSMPAILRPRPGTKARELMAVANIERKVRPQRDIDTTKFARKAWARKEVSVNPFLYGKKEELSAVRKISIETLRTMKVSNNGLKSPGADSSGSQLLATADSHGVAQLPQDGDRVDGNTGKSEQPKKKVWARKKSEEGKPDRTKKKS